MKFTTLVTICCLILCGCGGKTYKDSDPSVLLGEHEPFKYTPLKEREISEHDNEILRNLPVLQNFNHYSYKNINVGDISNSIYIKSLSQDLEKSTLHMSIEVKELKGSLYLGKKCVKGGFTCQGWADSVYRIHDLGASLSYKLQKITNIAFDKERRINAYPNHNRYIKQIVREDTNNGEMSFRDSTASILYLYYLQRHTFSFVFKDVNVPLKRFNMREGASGTWHFSNINLGLSVEEKKEVDAIENHLLKVGLDKMSLAALHDIYTKYKTYKKIKILIAAKYLANAKSLNSIEVLHDFNEKFSQHQPLVKQSVGRIYSIIKNINSVAGYEWFIDNYPYSKPVAQAISIIHNAMFLKAQKVGTVSALNAFIYSYPTSIEVNEANQLANKLEREIYGDLGLLEFWDHDAKKEKMARKLLIKAKQIERAPRTMEFSRGESAGFYIVADRMYKVLQADFNDTEATLRHLESKEFKDFTDHFVGTMKEVKEILAEVKADTSNISKHAKQILKVANRGFQKANKDRALSAYYAKKHREWEKNMQL